MRYKGVYVPCLWCDPEMTCKDELRFINGGVGHLNKHDGPKNLAEYKEWVAEEYELDPDQEVFHKPRALTGKNRFWEYVHLFRR